jgi:hypothetical protein
VAVSQLQRRGQQQARAGPMPRSRVSSPVGCGRAARAAGRARPAGRGRWPPHRGRRSAGAQEDRQQFGVGQAAGAAGQQLFAGTFVLGQSRMCMASSACAAARCGIGRIAGIG